MKNKVKIHIGYPKTGTTALQELLIKNQAAFEDNGIAVFDRQELFETIRITQKLELFENELSSSKDINFDSEINFLLKKIKNHKTKVISSENLIYLPKKSVDLIYSKASLEKIDIDIIVTLRNIDEWILSTWQQNNKSKSEDWIEFLESAIANKTGFLSTTLGPWITDAKFNKFNCLEYSKNNVLIDFLGCVDESLVNKLTNNQTYSKINSSVNLINSLYQNLLCFQTKNFCYQNLYSPASNIDNSLLERFLLDINDHANPTFEISQKFRSLIYCNVKILGTDSYMIFSKYLKLWSDDALKFLQLQNLLFDTKSKTVVENVAHNALTKSKTYAFNSDNLEKLPQYNFLDHLPLDSEFFSLARAVVYGAQFVDSKEKNVSFI